MEKSKFKEGDFVIIADPDDAHYSRTNHRMYLGKVVDVRERTEDYDYEDIQVEIMSHENKGYEGEEWWVDSTLFKHKYNPKQKRIKWPG